MFIRNTWSSYKDIWQNLKITYKNALIFYELVRAWKVGLEND